MIDSMQKKYSKAKHLDGSDEPLIFPDESIEIAVLERLLEDANEKRLNDSNLVAVLRHERARNWTPENMSYKNTKEKMTVGYLKKMYRENTGDDYSPEDVEYNRNARIRAEIRDNAVKGYLR